MASVLRAVFVVIMSSRIYGHQSTLTVQAEPGNAFDNFAVAVYRGGRVVDFPALLVLSAKKTQLYLCYRL